MSRLSLHDRFWSKVSIGNSDQCWNWNGYCEPKMGYGKFGWKTKDGKNEQYAHRYAFYTRHGYLPIKPLTVDHKCRNASCVNPQHLREATVIDQLDNSVNICHLNSKKSHCKHGHILDDRNTKIHKDGRRECILCITIRRHNREDYKGMLPSGLRTHCMRGHEYNNINTLYIKRPSRNTVERQCKICKKERRYK